MNLESIDSKAKVSMIITCYNKEPYIAEMFDTVIAQTWDNVEVILINDGSTDATRDIIYSYMPKFIKRGYETVFIDQPNRGKNKAMQSGFIRATGKYLCFPDCDDWLSPEYLSIPAKYLEENPTEVWVTFNNWWRSNLKGLSSKYSANPVKYSYSLFDSLLAYYVSHTSCFQMIRTDYFRKCNFNIYDIAGYGKADEPSMFALLYSGEAIPVFIPRMLYKYRKGIQTVFSANLEQHINDVYDNLNAIIDKLNFSTKETMWLKGITKIGRYSNLYKGMIDRKLEDVFADKQKEKWLISQLKNTVKIYFSDLIDADGDKIKDSGILVFLTAITNRILNRRPLTELISHRPNSNGRVICYGFGVFAKKLLPKMMHTPLKPDEIWDVGKNLDCEYHGIPICKPNFGMICDEDTVCVTVKNLDYVVDICDQLTASKAGMVLYYYDLLDWLANYYYPLEEVRYEKIE